MSEINQQQVAQETFNPFSGKSWTENLPQPSPQTEPTATTEEGSEIKNIPQPAAETQPNATTTPDIPVPTEWLKREFQIDDYNILKQEREELKKLKETPATPQEQKFENEQSKHIYELLRSGKSAEVRKFLEAQEQIEKYTTSEINKDTADHIIKLGMKLKYDKLTPEQIDFQFNEEYSAPKKPVQKTDELDSEFEERMADWKSQVDRVEMKKTIAATMAIPELESAKSKIVLPELEKPQTPSQEQPSQESLAALENIRKTIHDALDSHYSKVDGFSTTVKDELVELPVSFKIPDEMKVSIKDKLKGGFEPNDFFGTRWFDGNNVPKVEQMISDLYVMENLDKILSGVANNAASQRLAEHLKATKNLNVSQTPQQTFQPQENGGNQNVNPFAKGSWSEKPPSLQTN